jgi:hypothetical protein
VIIVSIIRRDRRSALSLPDRRLELLPGDFALGDDPVVDQNHRNAPVVEVVQAIVDIDVDLLRLMAKGPKQLQGLVA